MLITYLSRPLCINCDWLSLSIKIDKYASVTAPKGYRIDTLQGNNIFKERYILYNADGYKIATFLCAPYSPVIPEDIGTLQFSNPFLYNPDPNYLENLIKCFKRGIFNGISRYDVACDFVPTDAEFKTIRKLMDGSQYVSGKSEGSVFWHTEVFNDKPYRMPHCLSYGAPTSQLKVKLYNKSLEINAVDRANCSKPYILDEWLYHLPCVDRVWRLEFSLCDTNQVSFNGCRLDINNALSWFTLSTFFSICKNKRFIVRKNQGRQQGHKNNDEIIPFLPFKVEGLKLAPAKPLSERSPLDEQRALARQIVLHIQDESVVANETRFCYMKGLLEDLMQIPYVANYVTSLIDTNYNDFIDGLDNRSQDYNKDC